MTSVFILKYDDAQYPEDSRILGVYTEKDNAQKRLDAELSFYTFFKNGGLHRASEYYYTIEEHEITE